jgi:hypothetical protein
MLSEKWPIVYDEIALFSVLLMLFDIYCLFLGFMQASTSMLEARGEGITSWFEDDNFILDDDLAPDFEVQT